MSNYVKIIVKDKTKTLEHYYLRVKRWGIPGGRVEKNEKFKNAAKRELVQRTGYEVKLKDLKYLKQLKEKESITKFFITSKSKVKRVAKPGELGGYSTKIRWKI